MQMEVVEQAAKALCNVACGSDARRDAIAAAGAIPRLVALLSVATGVGDGKKSGSRPPTRGSRPPTRPSLPTPMSAALFAAWVLATLAFNSNLLREQVSTRTCKPRPQNVVCCLCCTCVHCGACFMLRCWPRSRSTTTRSGNRSTWKS